MKRIKRKGYLAERKVRMFFHRHGWITIKSGGSLGFADVVCLKKGVCILLQVKSTRKKVFYQRERIPCEVEGFPLYVVVDFGYGEIRVFKPRERMSREEGAAIEEFVNRY